MFTKKLNSAEKLRSVFVLVWVSVKQKSYNQKSVLFTYWDYNFSNYAAYESLANLINLTWLTYR